MLSFLFIMAIYSLGIYVHINFFTLSINARYSDTVSVIVSCTHQQCKTWSQLLPLHLLNQQGGDCWTFRNTNDVTV